MSEKHRSCISHCNRISSHIWSAINKHAVRDKSKEAAAKASDSDWYHTIDRQPKLGRVNFKLKEGSAADMAIDFDLYFETQVFRN